MNSARQRTAFIKQAAEELHLKETILSGDMQKLLYRLEELRDEQIRKALAPKEPVNTMSDDEREAALELLRDPRFLDASWKTSQRAAYPLKLLQSEGEVSIASTGKDPVSGKHVTHEYRAKGPVMIFLTTTAIDIDEELMNRCLVLAVNEERTQTQASHRIQRESQTIEGLLGRRDGKELWRLHRNAQRLLKPVPVANPLCALADLPRRPDQDAARPYEVPCAHPGRGLVASASAATADAAAQGQALRLHRSHARRHRRSEPSGARSVGPVAR